MGIAVAMGIPARSILEVDLGLASREMSPSTSARDVSDLSWSVLEAAGR